MYKHPRFVQHDSASISFPDKIRSFLFAFQLAPVFNELDQCFDRVTLNITEDVLIKADQFDQLTVVILWSTQS